MRNVELTLFISRVAQFQNLLKRVYVTKSEAVLQSSTRWLTTT